MKQPQHPTNWTSILSGLLVGTALASISSAQARDPFWPINYHGKNAPPVAVAQPTPTPLPRGLSWEEKLAIAREEAAKLTEHLIRQGTKGTLRMGNRLHIIIGKDFYAQGDSIKIQRDGIEYRLVITSLTEDNIQLEPARVERGPEQ